MKATTCRICGGPRIERYTLCEAHAVEYVSNIWAKRKDRINAARRLDPARKNSTFFLQRTPKAKPPKPPRPLNIRYQKPPEAEPVRDIRPTKPVRPVRHFEPERFQQQLDRAAYIQARLNRF
jgi:hypothetical protein